MSKKPKCLGLWLDTCLYGFKPCQTCRYIDKCKDIFTKECEGAKP